MKKLLCIDIDDVLCEFTDDYLQHLHNHAGLNITREDIRGSFTEMGLAGETMESFIKSGALRTMKVVEGSQKSVRRLLDKFIVVALTARPPYTEQQTREWVMRYFPNLPIVYTNDKVVYCQKVKAWGLVDDQFRWLNGVERGFAIAQSWNSGYEGARGDWRFITSHILSLI